VRSLVHLKLVPRVVQDAQPQRLLRRQVDEPALAAGLAGALDARVVPSQCACHSIPPKAERARERRLDQVLSSEVAR
jgi:hypothetical protein